jgi:transcriptional regulator
MADIFERFTDADVRDLIAEYPLAWLLGARGVAAEAAQLPLLGEYGEAGDLRSLLGHIPRRHVLVPAWEASPSALVLFQGPQAYVSPDQAGMRGWAPTWNFAQLSIEVEVEILPDETSAALASLVDVMEAARPDPWRADELGERYAGLARHVVAFRAHVKRVVGRFKLGQDEQADVRESIIRSLGSAPLASWMRRFAREGDVS